MTNRTPGALPPINFSALADALLARADQLVAEWLPGGAKRGHEWVCGSLAGGKGSSCSVNLTNGRWSDFACRSNNEHRPLRKRRGESGGRDLIFGSYSPASLFYFLSHHI